MTPAASPMSHGLDAHDIRRLSASIEHAFAVRDGATRRVIDVDRRPSSYRSSCAVDDIDVWCDDGSTIAIVAKAVDWNAMCPEARCARPPHLWDDERERAVYESILPTSQVTSPRYFGSYVSQSGIRYLLLERIPGVPLWQCGDFDAWREAARWLARMEACISLEAILAGPAAARLLRYDRLFYESWMRRACAFHADSSRHLKAMLEPHRKVVDWLLRERPVFIHGEFYSSNVLIERTAGGRAVVRPIDWEMASVGPASIDLACLLAGRWTDEQRADAADAYYTELAVLGRPVPVRERYLRTLDYCLIHLSVRNLGWSADWTPPSDRVHDWLGEALRLCEKWNL